MSISQAGPGQYLNHCAEQRCKSSVAIGLMVEIVYGTSTSELKPSVPNKSHCGALFTPCSGHIQNTRSYLDDLGFTNITEIPLQQLQEWAGSGKVETRRSTQSASESGISMSPESLQRLRDFRSRR